MHRPLKQPVQQELDAEFHPQFAEAEEFSLQAQLGPLPQAFPKPRWWLRLVRLPAHLFHE